MPETQKKQFLLLFSTFLTTLLTLSLLFFTNAIAWAGDVPLAWDPSPDNVDGYTIHYGPESGNYSSSDKVGNKTSHTVSGLAAGKYYFAVSAYKGSVESGYSNEVNTTIPDATGTSSGGNTGSGGSGGTSTTDGVYQQDSGAQGLLVMESEHFAGNVSQGGHDWVQVTDPAGFSGSGAMRASPVSGARIDTNYVANSPRLDFKVNFAKSGTHYVWLRGLSTSSADNSAHVGLDGQANTTADRIDFNSTSNWDWTNNTMDSIRATVNVATPGEHTVNVWMREDGLRLDRVVLATDANFVPSGTGPTESASQTGVQEAPVAEAPVARFSASPTSGDVPLIVTFSDASTGNIDTWSWDFGDGRTSTAQTAAYTYQTAGTFTVKLTVTGPGGTDTRTRTNYITASATTSGGSTGSGSTGSGSTGSGSTGSGTGGTSGGSGTVPGLVAAYGFEESGDVWVQDASGNANEGLIEGATRTSSSQGRFGRALAFDGINDWVTVNDDSSLDLTDGMTLEAWLYPTESMYSWITAFMKERPYGLVYSLCANSDANSPSTAVRIDNYDRNLKGGPSLQPNQWTHLAATYDGTTQRLYVNGNEVASQSVSGSIQVSDGVLRIGGTSVWTQFFKGRIDEVRIYNRALTAGEIKTDMTTPVVK